MSVPGAIAGRAVERVERAGGGDINDAYRLTLAGGTQAFLKTRADPGPGEYAAEAAGLEWLGDGGALVPAVLDHAEGFLALEWLEPGRLDAGGEEELGRRLAEAHRAGAGAFGATPHPSGLRIGPLRFDTAGAADWPEVYGERLLRPLIARAGVDRAAVERAIERLPETAGDPEPPARLHGDLWSGNVHPSGGRPYLIDPAAYGGHREVDLAMLSLFGAPSPRTVAAYEEVAPLADGHEERVGLWQLFPLLVHAALFGGSYVAAAERVARAYG